MFKIFTKKAIVIIMSITVFVVSLGYLVSSIVKQEAVASPYKLTIVLDAGHGGVDGGSVGNTTGIAESELNLIYVNKLEKLLLSAGINVIKTRSNLDGLYKQGSDNPKKEDMQKRKEIIANSGAQAVVSIHMNKFSLKSEKGAQVFYKTDDENGKLFADTITSTLIDKIENARPLTLGGDFFICKCTTAPSVIVECGFLSNDEEEVLLQNEEYQDKFCYAVFCGIIKYFNIATNEY